MAEHPKVAFALGGLAGNNAHGAGCLQAALTAGVEPVMLSCTSGQIFWAYQYLRLLRGGEGNLREALEAQIAAYQTFRNRDLDLAGLSLFGHKGVFKPAYLEYLADACRNAVNVFQQLARKRGNASLTRQYLQLFPCRLLVPEFPPGFFEAIAQEFADSRVGIVFNSYNPGDGNEYVYLNEAARELLSRKRPGPCLFAKGRRNTYRDRTTYQDVSPEAVRDGLWLYQYGFDQKENTFVDGAYFRQVILSELTYADRIYVARPMHFHWVGRLPISYPELEDLKTKVSFNGSYAGERYQVLLVNKLLADGVLQAPAGDKQLPSYHHIDLVEIEIEEKRGFFDYVFEEIEVFDDAFRQALASFRTHEGRGAGGGRPPKPSTSDGGAARGAA